MILESLVPLDISLPSPGIYYLGGIGSTGKSYLRKLLESCATFNRDKYLTITYDSRYSEQGTLALLKNFKGIYVMLDRADMYYTSEIGEQLKKMSCYILLDLKDPKYWWKLPAKVGYIEMTKDMLYLR